MPEDTPYDPYIPSGSNPQSGPAGQDGGDSRYQQLQKEIDNVTQQMGNNIRSVQDRGERLDVTASKASQLAEQSNMFRTGANRVRKQMWWKDMKMRVCLAIGIIVLILIIVLPVALTVGKH